MFANVQMLRAWAALMVVLHHLPAHYTAMGGAFTAFNLLAQWGFLGVDVFFVISGFIMGHTTFDKERTAGNALQFATHRLGRIYLGYWPFFLLALMMTPITRPQGLSNVDMLGSFFLTNPDLQQVLIGVSWSLTFELYFYALFTASFALSVRAVKLVVQLMLVLMVLRIQFLWIDTGPMSFFASHFLVEFLAGTCVYIYREQLKARWMPLVLAALLAAAVYYGIQWVAYNGPLRVMTFGTAAVLLLMLVLTLENRGMYRAGSFVTRLGDASYTLYLSHTLLIDVVYFVGLRDFLSRQHPVVREIGFVLEVVAIVWLSMLVYRSLERPLYKAFVRITAPRRWASVSTP